jgi:predicted amidophosphoribosyltransferase
MEPPLDAFVHALKFGGRPDLARPLGRLLARTWTPPAGAVVLGVPLHSTRRRERGYDQADLLGRSAGRAWRLPAVTGALRRSRATAPQARRSLEVREANVRGVFAAAWSLEAGPPVWVLVDDVATSGATLLAAARAARAAGVARVIPVALALA